MGNAAERGVDRRGFRNPVEVDARGGVEELGAEGMVVRVVVDEAARVEVRGARDIAVRAAPERDIERVDGGVIDARS